MTKEDIEQFLADCWVEINGGGVVTDDQIAAMKKIEDALDEQRIKEAYLPTHTWVDSTIN